MKKGLRIMAMAIILAVFGTACQKEDGIAEAVQEQQAKEYPNTPFNKKMEELAITFAKSLNQSTELRSLVKAEANKKVTGDFEVLFADIQDTKLTSGTVSQLAASNSAFAKKAGGADALKKQAAEVTNFQLSVPVNIEKWDAETFSPLVAFMPEGIDDTKVKWVKAFNADGEVIWLDAKNAPDFPVVVIGESERRLADGSLDMRFAPSKKRIEEGEDPYPIPDPDPDPDPTPVYYCDRAHNVDKYDYLNYAKFRNIDRKRDVEPWALGEAEVYVKVIFGKAQDAIADVKYGVWDDWGNTNWIGEYFTKEVYLNTRMIKWDRSQYGDVMKYIWFEEDGGNYGTFTVKFEPKLFGISLGKVDYSINIKNNDDWAGEQIVEWDDVNNSNYKGYYYETYYMYWYVRQK